MGCEDGVEQVGRSWRVLRCYIRKLKLYPEHNGDPRKGLTGE